MALGNFPLSHLWFEVPIFKVGGGRVGGGLFDVILSVEDVGIFKPAREVYSLVEEKLGVIPGKTNFFSSNAWDVAGASVFGFSVVWVNRFNQPAERLPGMPRLTVKNLEEWWEKEG